MFVDNKTKHKKMLKRSNHKVNLKCVVRNNNKDKTNLKECKNNIIWFNPLYDCNLKTNLGRISLNFIPKHFGYSPTLKKKVFNKNKIKVSYSCTKKS